MSSWQDKNWGAEDLMSMHGANGARGTHGFWTIHIKHGTSLYATKHASAECCIRRKTHIAYAIADWRVDTVAGHAKLLHLQTQKIEHV